jgi:glycogen operon protein
VNFVTAHDGFTLNDLVSYNDKHNEANGESNRDGNNKNLAWNCGVEGATGDPAITALREKQKRNLLATLLLSQGVPMLQAGDETGRTQHGNNNAYCQDNEISWLDWSLLQSEAGQALSDFVARLAKLRQQYVTLRRDRFMGDAEVAPGLAELNWWDERGVMLSPEDWDNPVGRVLIMRRAARRDDGKIEITAVMLNSDADDLDFHMPGEYPWQVVIDSCDPALQPRAVQNDSYRIGGRGAAIMVAEIDAPPPAAVPTDTAPRNAGP